MQLIICSLCCLFCQPGLVHLAYFSFPVSFFTCFHHLDAIWGILKKTRNGHIEPGEVQQLHHHPRSNLGEALKAPEGAVVPYPHPSFPSRPSRSTRPNATEPRAPAPAAEVTVRLFAGAAVSARRLYDPAPPTPLPACLVEMFPL